MGLHAIVALPEESTPGVDWAAIYAEYLKPALEDAGFSVLRADQAHGQLTRAGRFEKLLLADLVVVDLALDDADVWYELGLRHALLARGVVLVRRADQTATSNSDDKLDYQLRDGRPDAARLASDRQLLTRLALRNAASWQGPAGEPAQARPHALADERPQAFASGMSGASPARQVFLFSGHAIDAADRPTPRFPAHREAAAAAAIAARLEALGMGEQDLAISGGASGGELLFAEAALRRACPLHLYLPAEEDEFVQASVAFAGPAWVERYQRVRSHPLTRVHVQPQEIGVLEDGIDAGLRTHLWQLCTALVQGAAAIHFIALWDGEGGAGPGSTQNLADTVRRYAGQVSILDTRPLFGLEAHAR